MPRYLTPSTITLLTLTTLYTDNLIPQSSTLPILTFLSSNLLPLSPSLDAPSSTSSRSHTNPLHSIASAKSTSHTIPLSEFENATKGLESTVPGRTVWDLLVKRLWSLDCFDRLDSFLTRVKRRCVKQGRKEREEGNTVGEEDGDEESDEEDGEDWLRSAGGSGHEGGLVTDERIMLTPQSLLGSFIRRTVLEYANLQFHDSTALWNSFLEYRAETIDAWMSRNAGAGDGDGVDAVLGTLGLDSGDVVTGLVYGGLRGGEQHGDEDGGGKKKVWGPGVSRKDVERLLEFAVGEMQRLGTRIPEEMRAVIGNMIRAGCEMPSMSYYVQFLDAWRSGDYPTSFDNLHRYFDYSMQHMSSKALYHYALLNLAILQEDFGSYPSALAAIQEAISTAREAKDMQCLNFCMTWLYQFGKAHPELVIEGGGGVGVGGSEKEGLVFLKAKAKETEMWSMLSTLFLSEGKMELMNGESLASAFECIVKSSHLNVFKFVPANTGPQMMMQAGLFSRIGLAHLEASMIDIFTECYARNGTAEDYMRAVCQSASVLCRRGRYDEAMAKLDELDGETLRTLKTRQIYSFLRGLLKARHLIDKDDLPGASYLLSQLASSPAPDHELQSDLSLLQIELLLAESNPKAALVSIQGLAKTHAPPATIDIISQIALLQLKSRIYITTHNPELAFTLSLRACHLAHKARLLPSLWTSITHLSTVLISISESPFASTLLESILPQVLETQDSTLICQTYSVLADSYVSLAGSCPASSKRRKEFLVKVLDALGVAAEEARRARKVRVLKEMLAKRATVMHVGGDWALADDEAARYGEVGQGSHVVV